MIPIRDTIRSRSFPLVNWLLIFANAAVFIFEINLSNNQLDQMIFTYGLVPARMQLANPLTWQPLFTHMFLHAGWLHIVSNMWVLYIFGDNVEDRLGMRSYLVFYLMGGLAAGLLQATLTSDPNQPAIGASGAIAAVMGAYFFFYPTAKVKTLILFVIIPWFIELPAVVFLGFWFLSQFYSGVLSLATSSGAAAGGVAWWAHVGGFLFGLIIGPLLQNQRLQREWVDDEINPW